MTQQIKVVHVDDVPIERMQEADGWAISEFRLPISGADGSATTIFHSIFRAGSTHAKHVHHDCDEITVYLTGHGVVGQDDRRAEAVGGHRRLIPQGSEHFFHNESEDEAALVIGFYMGAGSVEASGYEHRGEVGEQDVERPLSGFDETGALVQVDDLPPADMSAFDAWKQATVRISVGSHTGSPNTLLDAQLPSGAKIAPHRLGDCEQLYYVFSGSAVLTAGNANEPVRDGHVLFVPKDVEFALENTGDEPLWIVGVLTGAGSFADAGYAAA